MIRRRLVLFLGVFAAVSFLLPAGTAVAGGQPTRKSVLKNIDPWNKPVYFIHIFDGNFPIPTRFEIYPEDYKKSGSIRFQSSFLTLKYSFERNNLRGANVDKTGMIEIGTSSSFIKSFWGDNEKDSIRKFECYGLDVETKATPDMRMENEHGGSSQITAALIHNKTQYVLVFSTGSLWKQLLSVYGALSDKEEGPTCRIHKLE